MSVAYPDFTVIYAEDEFVFREIATPCILNAGIDKQALHVAEDGLKALEFLDKLQDEPNNPLLMLLDVRMPGMDGNQCAEKVKELVAKKALKREPFMVCCSAAFRKVTFDETGVFHITLPKPFGKNEASLCLSKAREWFESRAPAGGAASSSPPPAFDPGQLDIIVADDEPICHMAIMTSLTNLGISQARIREAEEEEEVTDAVQTAQAEPDNLPLIVLLGNPAWGVLIKNVSTAKRKPFLISTSVEGDAASGEFDAFLSRQYTKDDMLKVLEQCFTSFHSR